MNPRIGHIAGVDCGQDDDADVLAAAADLAVYVQGGRGAFLPGGWRPNSSRVVPHGASRRRGAR